VGTGNVAVKLHSFIFDAKKLLKEVFIAS